MKFLLFVEGDTEKIALGDFIQRWLNSKLSCRVGIKLINFKGNRHFRREILKKVNFHLGRNNRGEIIAAIGLLDLYKGATYPPDKPSVSDRYEWAVEYYEKLVGHDKFRMFFAVHETEAWLLSDTSIFPHSVRQRIPNNCSGQPENVNFDRPPAKRLKEFYRSATNKSYKKTTQGKLLFEKLDPQIAYDKCPYLKRMLDTLLELAQKSGL